MCDDEVDPLTPEALKALRLAVSGTRPPARCSPGESLCAHHADLCAPQQARKQGSNTIPIARSHGAPPTAPRRCCCEIDGGCRATDGPFSSPPPTDGAAAYPQFILAAAVELALSHRSKPLYSLGSPVVAFHHSAETARTPARGPMCAARMMHALIPQA